MERSGGAGGALGSAGRRASRAGGRPGPTERRLRSGPEWSRTGWAATQDVTLQESDVRVAFYGPVGTSHRFTTSHYKGGRREIHSYY
jgi:hypothetical protein